MSLTGMALSLFALGLAFAVGLRPVFWLVLSEIYPLRIRGRAMSVATAANWSANLIVALTFLTLTQILGKSYTFWIYCLISIGTWLFAFFLVPETRGRSLEDIEANWRPKKGTGSAHEKKVATGNIN
jgi:SP family galactose:H+ symporter-like MFS transporter